MPVSTDASKCPVEGFQGKWYVRSSPDYGEQAYQYATTSMFSYQMMPKLILVPTGNEDVKKAIAYAREQGVQIAIRTGGHQYCGASSTGGNNIQIDLSEAYLDWTCDRGDATRPATVRTGISLPLIEFNKRLGANKLFVPTGQCCNVHLGGHIQTGGYGQLARAFGLLGDHILSFDLITAKGETRTVHRDANNADERDLYYAVLGGSPGNFGVLTHATIQAYRDEDYPESRGLRGAYLYEKERLARLLKVVARLADRPRSYDMCVTVLTADSNIFPHYCFLTGHDEEKRDKLTDEYMREHHPERYGTEASNKSMWPSIVIVYAQWANAGERYNDDVKGWFDEIKEAIGTIKLPFAFPLPDEFNVKPDVATPMSRLCRGWTFENVREYALPYEKRTHLSDWGPAKLEVSGWADWLTERIDWVQSQAGGIVERNKTGLKLCIQIQNFGGDESMYCKNGQAKTASGQDVTAYSWRATKIGAVLDCFYDATLNPDAHQIAIDWQKENERGLLGIGGGTPNFSDAEPPQRWLWASFGDRNMGNAWPHYYTPDQYDRLCRLKSAFDPAPSVFTPNKFCVGVPSGLPDLPPGGRAEATEAEDRENIIEMIAPAVNGIAGGAPSAVKVAHRAQVAAAVDAKMTSVIKGRIHPRLKRLGSTVH